MLTGVLTTCAVCSAFLTILQWTSWWILPRATIPGPDRVTCVIDETSYEVRTRVPPDVSEASVYFEDGDTEPRVVFQVPGMRHGTLLCALLLPLAAYLASQQ